MTLAELITDLKAAGANDNTLRLALNCYELGKAEAQRKPLTDEQIFVIKHNWITTPFVNHLDFARAIEAAHGIKE